MLAHPIAAALLFGTNYAAATTTAPRPKKAPNKLDFLRAMNIHTNNIKAGKQRKLERSSTGDARVDFQNELLHGKTKSSAVLRKKVIEKSTFVKKTPSAAAAPDDAAGRKLTNNNNNNGYKYNENYSGNDDWYNNQADLWENDFGFNVLQYSVSYAGCAAVKQFDEGEFLTKRFVTFRLCPENTCSGWEWDYGDNSGCGCTKQCNSIADYEDAQGAGFDDESCMNACFKQCETWGNVNGGNNRRLEDAKNYNWQDGNEEYNEYSNYEFDPYWKENYEYEWGANGEGCSSDYGEYMMEMNEYLELQMEWQEQRIETYQEYCEECMMAVYQAWIKSQGRARHLTYEEFKDSDEHRRLGDDVLPEDSCPQYETCRYYNKVEVEDPYSEYFECKEVEGNNGQIAYIGPHCAEGGYEITLGLYSDDQCEEYIGNSASIVKYLGEEVDEAAMKSYYASAHGYALDQLQFVNDNESCVPCNTADLMWDIQMFHESDDNLNQNYDQNQNNYANNEYESEINELCSSLYQSSARCDKNFNSYKYKQEIDQGEYGEYFASEDLVCEFIDSVAQRNYGEDGFVDVNEEDYVPNTQKWGTNMRAQQYGQAVEKVAGMQVFGLVLSLALLAGLAMWAGSLHKSLSKSNLAWRPKQGMASTETDTGVEDLRRENSGVVMGRSATNTSYYMS